MTTVFISYRHEKPEHQARVLGFAERLKNDGVGVVLDKFLPAGGPGEGWNRWSERQVSFVDQTSRPDGAPEKILIVASRGWFKVYEGNDDDQQTGFGAACEAIVIQDLLSRWKMNRGGSPVRIVSFGEILSGEIPPGLRDLPRFDVSRQEKYAELVNWIAAETSRPPPRSPWPDQPPRLEPWKILSGMEARETCAAMLTSEAARRVLRLVLSGNTEDTKIPVLLCQCALNVEGRHGVKIRAGRLDLKGGTVLGIELEEFAHSLGCEETYYDNLNLKEIDQLKKIFRRLKDQQTPTLLIFDSIERGADFSEWITRFALAEVPKVEWLRVVTSGGEAPDPAGAAWGKFAGEPLRVNGSTAATAPAKEDQSADAVLQRLDSICKDKSPADRAALRDAFIAACVPHWCDPLFLTSLLEENLRPRAAELLDELRTLPEIEPFGAHGKDAVNVTALVRTTLRRHLAQKENGRLKDLSARAAAHLSGNDARTMRMERIYHRLVAEGDAAAEDAEALDAEFWQGFGAAEHAIYAGMLLELADEGSIKGQALVEALLSAGFSASKQARPDDARSLALRAREVAQSGVERSQGRARAFYLSGIARTHCIEGELASEKIDIPSAKKCYEKYLALIQEACAAAPDHIRLRREHAVAESRVANCCEPKEALPHFRRSRALQESVVAAKPGDEAERRELSMMDSLEGNAHFKLGHEKEALEFFTRFVAGCRGRVEKDPANMLWLGDFADGLRQLGDAQMRAALTAGALKTFREGVEVAQRWVDLDPVGVSGAGRLSGAHNATSFLHTAEERLISALLTLAEFTEARKLCTKHFASCKDSADAAPGNSDAQFRLGVAHFCIGDLHRCQGVPTAALPSYQEAERIYEALVAKNRDLLWRREQAKILGLIGGCQKEMGRTSEAGDTFAAQLALCEILETEAPGDYGTQSQMVWAHLYLAALAADDSRMKKALISSEQALVLARKLAFDELNAEAQRTLAQALFSNSGFRMLKEKDLDALAATDEAIKIYKTLAEKAPSDIGRQFELANAHVQMAVFLEKWGMQPEAAGHRKIAADLYGRNFDVLARAGIENFAAICAAEQSALLVAQDNSGDRAATVARAITLFRMLITQTERFCEKPENQSLEGPRKKLIGFHHALGELFLQKPAVAEATAQFHLALAGWEKFQEQQPERAEWQHNAANVRARLAEAAMANGDFALAGREFSAAITGLEESWQRTSSNPFWRRNLIIARYRRANMFALAGKEADALADLEKCRAHLEYIDQLPDQGNQTRRDMIDLERLTGTVLTRLGRPAEAIEAYSVALDRARKLDVLTGSKDVKLRALISETEGWLGIACSQADKLGEAEVFLKKRLAFCEDELAKEPANAVWRYGQGAALAELGAIQTKMGDVNAALVLHRSAIEALEPLASNVPPFQMALRDLATLHNTVAILLYQRGDLDGAIHHGRRAIEVMEKLVSAAPAFPVYAGHLETYRKNLDIYLQAPSAK